MGLRRLMGRKVIEPGEAVYSVCDSWVCYIGFLRGDEDGDGIVCIVVRGVYYRIQCICSIYK